MKSIEKICFELRILLEKSVEKNLAEGILLSGGLDTSILAAVASKYGSMKAFTVALEGVPAPDVEYAKKIAKLYEFDHCVYYLGNDELFNDALPFTIRTVQSFDRMEIRNDVVIYFGLSQAKTQNLKSVMTGDGADELFAGYSFLFGLENQELHLQLQKMWGVMTFSSVILANDLGIEAKLPYLDPEFKSFAMEIDPKHKVRFEKGKKWGKWILRKAYEEILPEEIIWRTKTPIETGSGASNLPEKFEAMITDKEFEEKKQKYLKEDKVALQDKEHLFYYEIYKSEIGIPHPTDHEGRICPNCNSNVPEKATFCRTCGAYPI